MWWHWLHEAGDLIAAIVGLTILAIVVMLYWVVTANKGGKTSGS